MTSKTLKQVGVAMLAGITLFATLDQASAYQRNRYTHTRSGVRYGGYGYHRYHHRYGYGPAIGGAVAGAALGLLGAATAGIAADRYYEGYPAYTYGPAYGYGYGYDYHPGYGYYGPY